MTDQPVAVLLIGSGVIGSVYAGQLALAGHDVWVLAHGEREQFVAQNGLRLKNIANGTLKTAAVRVADSAGSQAFDLVIVAVRAEQLDGVMPALRSLQGTPHIVFFGNNPDGHAALPGDLPGTVQLAFPGVGGGIVDGTVEYIPVDQQPTAFEQSTAPMGLLLRDTLVQNGFAVQEIADMDGWLAYHAVFISCMSVAVLDKDGDAAALGQDRAAVRRMCQAIGEGFRMLKMQGVGGAPKNLSVLHSRLLLPIATMYWDKLLRSPKGEQYFAAHARHASGEVYTLASWVYARIPDNFAPHLKELLQPKAAS